MEAQKLESRLEPSVFPQKQLVFKRNYSDQGFFQSTEMSVFDLEIGSAALFFFLSPSLASFVLVDVSDGVVVVVDAVVVVVAVVGCW